MSAQHTTEQLINVTRTALRHHRDTLRSHRAEIVLQNDRRNETINALFEAENLVEAIPALLAALAELSEATALYCAAIDEGGHEETHANRLVLAQELARAALAATKGRP